MANILIGPAGWSYADWKGIVYPSRRPKEFREPAFLSQFFDVIEINTSFYQPLKPQMCREWLAQVASNARFVYTAKLWRKFTHEGTFEARDVEEVRAGYDVLAGAGRLGALLLQFPFSFHRTPENMKKLKDLEKNFQEYQLVVEVRHASWLDESFFDWLREHNVGFCNIDQPIIGRSIEPTEHATSSVAYVRLHGRRYDTWFDDDPDSPPSERYNYLYSTEELEPWAERIRKASEGAKTTYVITNNHFEAKGIVNSLELMHLLFGEKVKVPEELRHHYPRLEQIANSPSKEPTLFPV
jgi:uncharacterized protein YecE (DUF72 family)